jgi:type IV pilus assembly protein PilM
MGSLIRSSQHRVHFVIKDRYIRFIESGKKNSFLSYGQKCLPEGVIVEGQIKQKEIFAMILDEIVDEYNLKGRKITFCVPDSFVVIRKVLVPFEVVEDELKGYLYMQLGDTLHLPFEDPVFEAIDIGKKSGQKEILLIATKESIIHEFTDLFKECSLKPVVADLSILSLYRLYYNLGQSEVDEHALIVQIGVDTIQLSVFANHRPEFLRLTKLPVNESQIEPFKARSGQEYFIWKDEEKELDSLARDTINEIERFMTFYRFNLTKGRNGITKLILTGDHPGMEYLEKRIEGSFEVPIQSLLKPLFQTKKGYNIPPVFTDCIGLALK